MHSAVEMHIAHHNLHKQTGYIRWFTKQLLRKTKINHIEVIKT